MVFRGGGQTAGPRSTPMRFPLLPEHKGKFSPWFHHPSGMLCSLQTAELSPSRAGPSGCRRPASAFTEQVSADLLWQQSLTQASSAASRKVLDFAVLCFPGSSDVTLKPTLAGMKASFPTPLALSNVCL